MALAAGTGLPLLALAAISASLASLGQQPQDAEATIGSTLEVLALVAAGASAVMLVLIVPIAAIGRRSRPFLGLVFRPVLLVVLMALLVVIVIDGALVIGSVYFVEAAFLGIVQPWLLAVLAIAVLVAAVGVLQATATMLERTPLVVRGVRLGRETNPGLFELVADLAADVGTDPPRQVLAGLDPTFFVVESDVAAFGRWFTGRTLFLSVPLCRVLSVDELKAVVAHELGHFKGDDTAYTRRFAPGYRGAVNSLVALQVAAGRWSGIPLLAPLLVLRACLEQFETAQRQIGRARELAADMVAATVTSPEAIGTALLKLSAYSGAWNEVFSETVAAVHAGRDVGNISERYAQRARAGANVAAITGMSRDLIPHPFDTHPPVPARLAALGVSAEHLAGQAAAADPARPAIDLIEASDALEVALSERLAADIGASLGPAPRGAGKDPSLALRAAAAGDPALSRVIRLFEPLRGPSLGRPPNVDGPWVALADLEVAPHPAPGPFRSFFPDDVLPTGEQRLVIDLAGPDVPDDRRVDAGTMLWLAGLGPDARRQAGHGETCYIDGGNGVAPTQLLVVREVGDAPLAHQVAGLFVVPASDPLAFDGGPLAAELRGVVRGVAGRGRHRAEGPPSSAVTPDDANPDPASQGHRGRPDARRRHVPRRRRRLP